MCNVCEINRSRFRGGCAEHTGMPIKIKNKAVLPVYVRGLVSGKYTLRQAAESTGYSVPYLCDLKKRYSVLGDSVFEHKNKGCIPHNRIPQAQREYIAALYAKKYQDVNFSYFLECLHEFEDISVSYVTLRSILLEFGQRSPEAHKVKKKKIVHRPRLRRECEGDLLQIDGTPYAWFYKFGNNKRYCMVGAIDDATGKITGLYITENECLYGYLEILRQTAEHFGLPREIYSDRAAIFCYTPRGQRLAAWERLEVMHDKRTQWQRILEELNINQILAWSPEAKGRVERMWRTLQGQLPQWFYNRGISTVEAANAALPEYIRWFNKKFSVEPAVDDPFWLDAPENLDDILCAQFSRHIDNKGLLSFHNTQFYVRDIDLFSVDVVVCISERGLFAKYRDAYYRLWPFEDRVQKVVSDKMPTVIENIIYRYLYAFAKEISA